ncbi:MAG TPA: hypothetical protein VHG71_12770 [Verrucomicrobiae bacterium]|nr:hypothetical protein [Verrucomicrobiae bacterium]
MGKSRFQNLLARSLTGCVACMALTASAQLDFGSSTASSMDTFGGNPDSYAFIKIPSDTDDWTRHFRIGAMVGMNIHANFNETGLFNVSGNKAANGIYDDGYVRPDQTGSTDGYTSYWGYNNASQIQGNNLLMHSTTSFSEDGRANDNHGVFPGFEMAYGGNLWYWKHARVGWELGFGLLPISVSDNSSIQTSVSQTTFTFNTGGIVVPSAPYPGGPDGGSLISTAYTSSTTNLSGTITGSRKLDVFLSTLRLGPSFYWDVTEHVGFSLGAGPAIGFVAGKYKYDEIITPDNGVSAHNKGSFDTTGFTFGGYVNGTVMYHIMDWNGKTGDIFAGAQYMPMKDVSFGSGGRDAQLRLGGQLLFSVGINWPF